LSPRFLRGVNALLCATAFTGLLSVSPLAAQEAGAEGFDVSKYKAMTVSIVARISDKSRPELDWKSESSKVTIPGRPVGVKLVGANIIVLVQLTPYFTETNAIVLVAQGQVWIADPRSGLDYRTSLKTIPASFGEKLFFFPLGVSQDEADARIELEIIVDP
jgi:hypothetical protein